MIPIIQFVLGVAVLVYCAEKLIGHLVGVASRWAVSLFLIAVVFTGIEFDDLAFGVVLNLEDLSEVALGTVIGTTVAMTGIVLALAALIAPCKVDVPKDYLALFVIAPVLMFGLALLGALTVLTGVLLIVLFVAFVGWIAYREYTARRPIWRNAEVYERIEKSGGGTATLTREGGPDGGPDDGTGTTVGNAGGGFSGFDLPPDLRVDQGFLKARAQSPGATIALAVLALVGLVIGAVVAGEGTEGMLEEFAISGTVFGVTIATLALTLEDILLTVEPSRRGAPEIGIANVLGSVVFSVTGKLGVILIVGGAITVDPTALSWHLPVLIGMTVLSAIFLATGQLKRWHGVVLLALYVAYFVVSLTVFGGVPVDD